MFWWLRRIGSGVGSFLCSQAIFDADWSVSRIIRSTRSGTSLLFPSFPSPSSLRDPMPLFKNQRVLWSFCNCFFLTVYHASFFLKGIVYSCWPWEFGGVWLSFIRQFSLQPVSTPSSWPQLPHHCFSGPCECHDLSTPRLRADFPTLIGRACYQVPGHAVFTFPSSGQLTPDSFSDLFLVCSPWLR